jgi:hypothetical protein
MPPEPQKLISDVQLRYLDRFEQALREIAALSFLGRLLHAQRIANKALTWDGYYPWEKGTNP